MSSRTGPVNFIMLPPPKPEEKQAKDVEMPADATDTISAIACSPTADFLAAASWDGKVRVYDVGGGVGGGGNPAAARGVALLDGGGPVLSVDWSQDGGMLLAGGADRNVHALDASTGHQAIIGAHDAPIQSVRFASAGPGGGTPIAISGSWDGTVRLWDLRQRTAAVRLECDGSGGDGGGRVRAMDARGRLLVVGTASRQLHLVDLWGDPTRWARSRPTGMEHGTRAVAVAATGEVGGQGGCWATGSVEGRVAVKYLEEKGGLDDYTFRCHRRPAAGTPAVGTAAAPRTTNVYAVNVVACHPTQDGHMATAGGDGGYTFWEYKKKVRIMAYPATTPTISTTPTTTPTTSPFGTTTTTTTSPFSTNTGGTGLKGVGSTTPNGAPPPVTAGAFNRDGSAFVYALGYDWSEGYAGNAPTFPTRLMWHAMLKEDLQKGG